MDGIKWRLIRYYPKDQVVDHIKKSIEEAIQNIMDGPKFIEGQNLTNLDILMKNKAQNGFFQHWLIMFSHP